MAADPVRDAAKMLEFGAHPSSDLPDCYIVHGTDLRMLRDALRSALALPRESSGGDTAECRREATPPATTDAEAVRKIRDYAVKCAAVCREAEGERARDIASRPDNVMLDILRQQHYAWGQ